MSISTYCHKQSKREDLRERIYSNHLAYLAQEDSPGKLEKVKTLESLIEEFLGLVPHAEKFSFPSISDVLSQAILNNQEFSAHKAAAAFKAIEKYATNLLVNPWRKEYRNIKLYGGFYKHTIECHLPSAYSVFMAMGYKKTGLELLLEEPLDPDLVARVALDCFVAFVECQIMIRICESLTSFKCSWAEIHRVRQNYICAVEEATRLLQQMKRAQKDITPVTTPTAMPSYPPTYADSGLGTLWLQGNGSHHPGYDSNLLVDITNTNSSVNTRKHPQPPPLASSHLDDDLMKDDFLAPLTLSSRGRIQLDSLSVSRTRSPSWTEGLSADHYQYGKPKSKMAHPIRWESEGSDPYEVYSNGAPLSSSAAPFIGQRCKWTTDGGYQVPPLAVEDSWDVVDYSNPSFLMSCGNSGSLPQRFPVVPSLGMPPPLLPVPISNSSNGSANGNVNHRYQQPMIDLHHTNSLPRKIAMDPFEGFTMRNTGTQKPPPYRYTVPTIPAFPNDPSMCPESWTMFRYEEPKVHSRIKTEPLESKSLARGTSHHNSSKESNSKPSIPKRNSFYDNVPITSEVAPIKVECVVQDSSSVIGKTHGNRVKNESNIAQKSETVKKGNHELGNNKKGWSCSSCTYYNGQTKDICDMCGRTRNLGEDSSPLLSGGKQCPQCTLVNDKELNFCSACETSLKDSPTYI